MHVLFITEKYHTGPAYGLTNNIYNLIGSYECSGFGTYTHLFNDPENICSTQGIDDALMSNQYDMAVISPNTEMPSHNVAQQIGYKTVMCWWDSTVFMDDYFGRGGVYTWSKMIHQLCFDWGKGEEQPNCFCVEVPQDTRLFCRDNTPEDLDVSFVGSIDTPRSDRTPVIQKLTAAGFKVWAGGGRGPGRDNLSIQEYVNIFKKSKICLNLSFRYGKPQRKGRAFEIAACGQFMMSNRCDTFAGKDGNWFEPEIDYANFDDTNLVERVSYFLSHDEERERMANNMYKKYCENYSPVHFWRKIFSICGVIV